jgi:hypothetical protein
MISILVDEGYAYDFLAILEVKKTKNLKNSYDNWCLCQNSLELQVGKELHQRILFSQEYKNLYIINEQTFNAVEKARYGTITAKEVDNLNMKRYNCKLDLQNKFFPSTKVSESKT